MKRLSLLAAGLALSSSPAAASSPIDFEDRGTGFSTAQTFGEFRIAAPASFWINATSGTKAMFPAMGMPTTLKRLDGGAFSLVSAVFFAGDSNGLGVPITFAFTRADGSSGLYTIATPEYGPGAPIASTRTAIAFGGNLSGVTAISWSNGAEFHQIDDLVLGPVAEVPEPSAWALLVAGFGALGTAMRRRRARRSAAWA